MIKKSYINCILLISGHNADFTSSMDIIKKKLLSKELYKAPKIRDT